MMLIFTIFFGRLAGVESSGVPYPLFALGGLVPWTFFSNSVTSSSNSLVGSANLITKVYFPRLIVPAAALMAGLVDFALSFMLLVALMIWYRVGLTVQILFLPFVTLLMVLFSLGVGTWMSALNVKYRDVGIALPVLVQLWMFVSPIVYSANLVPQRWRTLYSLNPLVGLVEGFRSSLLGTTFHWPGLAITIGVTFLLLIGASLLFRRTEQTFADIV